MFTVSNVQKAQPNASGAEEVLEGSAKLAPGDTPIETQPPDTRTQNSSPDPQDPVSGIFPCRIVHS